MKSEMLMDSDELAALLGLAATTVRWYSTQMPDRLPPRVKGFKKPVWSRKTVASWIESREEEKPQAKPLVRPKRVAQNGRPRRATL